MWHFTPSTGFKVLQDIQFLPPRLTENKMLPLLKILWVLIKSEPLRLAFKSSHNRGSLYLPRLLFCLPSASYFVPHQTHGSPGPAKPFAPSVWPNSQSCSVNSWKYHLSKEFSPIASKADSCYVLWSQLQSCLWKIPSRTVICLFAPGGILVWLTEPYPKCLARQTYSQHKDKGKGYFDSSV